MPTPTPACSGSCRSTRPDISTEAATHLTGTNADETNVEVVLQDLARAHLVEPGQIWGRWRLHDLVRLYADDQGHACGDKDWRDHAQARLFGHYEETAQAANTHLSTGPGTGTPRFTGRADALVWLDAERDNLIATATTAHSLGHPITSAKLAFTLAQYLSQRRAFTDLINVTATALTIMRETGDRPNEAHALSNLGSALHDERRFAKAIDAHTQSLAICREIGDRHGEGVALHNLALAQQAVQQFTEAIETHTQAAAIYRKIGDQHREAHALNMLGGALWAARRFDDAITVHSAAAVVYRDIDEDGGEATALTLAALAHTERCLRLQRTTRQQKKAES
ncbi:tetratricopeptide repeat protein [Streptomyces camelliae]|uniref:Tetratricopeptide repeat protein n=1 Tax=Streptomyces camelliae TaxID=3004093 RepID=A0ABY7PGN4_9ACTN|nr:tetratricopeptide repeat protein [Streptomyces sp. HUAS 2-6]WBO69029.1 tetratricopeptide repeat protein [Streptomyces sp. HUAS 2-6]